MLSQNLKESISTNEEDILSLPIQTIYLIIKKYFEKNPNCEKNDQVIIEFLFHCLDKYQRRASPLFSFIDFGMNRFEYIGRLLNHYSDIFDFHYVNPNFLNSLYEQNNELIQKTEILQIEIHKQQEQFQKNILKIYENEVGSFFYSTQNEDDLNGAIKCNGQKIAVSKYPTFVLNYLKSGKIRSLSIEKWEEIKKKNGSVGHFGYNQNGNVFIAPLIQAGTFLSNAVGCYKCNGITITPKQGDFANDQIVNIKGGFDWNGGCQGKTEVWHANGPFTPSVFETTQAPEPTKNKYYINNHSRGVIFDASKVVPTGDRVMPKTIFLNLYVKIFPEFQFL